MAATAAPAPAPALDVPFDAAEAFKRRRASSFSSSTLLRTSADLSDQKSVSSPLIDPRGSREGGGGSERGGGGGLGGGEGAGGSRGGGGGGGATISSFSRRSPVDDEDARAYDLAHEPAYDPASCPLCVTANAASTSPTAQVTIPATTQQQQQQQQPKSHQQPPAWVQILGAKKSKTANHRSRGSNASDTSSTTNNTTTTTTATMNAVAAFLQGPPSPPSPQRLSPVPNPYARSVSYSAAEHSSRNPSSAIHINNNNMNHHQHHPHHHPQPYGSLSTSTTNPSSANPSAPSSPIASTTPPPGTTTTPHDPTLHAPHHPDHPSNAASGSDSPKRRHRKPYHHLHHNHHHHLHVHAHHHPSTAASSSSSSSHPRHPQGGTTAVSAAQQQHQQIQGSKRPRARSDAANSSSGGGGRGRHPFLGDGGVVAWATAGQAVGGGGGVEEGALEEEKGRDFGKIFPDVRASEPLIDEVQCAIQTPKMAGLIMTNGRLFITPHRICFYSTVFGPLRLSIPLSQIEHMRKHNLIAVIPNAISVWERGTGKQTVFHSFNARDETFALLHRLWMGVGRAAAEVEEGVEEVGVAAAVGAGSNGEVGESEALSSVTAGRAQASNVAQAPATALVAPTSPHDTPARPPATSRPRSIRRRRPAASSRPRASPATPPTRDCPCAPLHDASTPLVDAEIPLPFPRTLRLLYGPDSDFRRRFLERDRLCRAVRLPEWGAREGAERTVEYVIPLGVVAPRTVVREVVERRGRGVACVRSESETPDVYMGDCFRTELRVCLTAVRVGGGGGVGVVGVGEGKGAGGTARGTRVRASFGVVFVKPVNSWVAGIVKAQMRPKIVEFHEALVEYLRREGPRASQAAAGGVEEEDEEDEDEVDEEVEDEVEGLTGEEVDGDDDDEDEQGEDVEDVEHVSDEDPGGGGGPPARSVVEHPTSPPLRPSASGRALDATPRTRSKKPVPVHSPASDPLPTSSSSPPKKDHASSPPLLQRRDVGEGLRWGEGWGGVDPGSVRSVIAPLLVAVIVALLLVWSELRSLRIALVEVGKARAF